MNYHPRVKTKRLEATLRDLMTGDGPAFLEVGTDNMETILGRIELPNPPAEVEGDTLTVRGLPAETRAIAEGEPTTARLINGAGEVSIDRLLRGVDFDLETPTLKLGMTVRLKDLLIIHP